MPRDTPPVAQALNIMGIRSIEAMVNTHYFVLGQFLQCLPEEAYRLQFRIREWQDQARQGYSSGEDSRK